MAHLAKSLGLLCLLAFTVSANANPNVVVSKPEGRTKVAATQSLVVNYGARIATPIKYVAEDYDGPYDPLDPKGIIAASHRHAKLVNKKNAAIIKSYVPPGINKVAKKEMSKVVVGEGRRFAFSHPKETANVLGIAVRAKKLLNAAVEKVKKNEIAEHK